ncbi:MAG: FxsA family protein [Spirochaetia bacterium]
MFPGNLPLKIIKQNLLVRVLFLSLLYSIIPLSEIILLFILGAYIGNAVILMCAALPGVLGVLIIVLQIQSTLKRIKAKIKAGTYPGKEFVSLAGVLLGAVLLLTPGFITDFLGFLLFVPFFRNKIGNIITSKMESRLKDIYEYLKLYEL